MRRRTGLLFSSAVVAGLLGGTAAGWGIQQSRPATPLPALPTTVGVLAGPAPTQSPDPATDDAAKLDGDLRKLLLDKPADATDPKEGEPVSWRTISSLAELAGKPDVYLHRLNETGFRRAARRYWTAKDGSMVDLELTQFRTTSGADSYMGATNYAGANLEIKGTSKGVAWASDTKNRDDQYWGMALALHGTVVVEVYVFSDTKVDPKVAQAIAEQQLGRL